MLNWRQAIIDLSISHLQETPTYSFKFVDILYKACWCIAQLFRPLQGDPVAGTCAQELGSALLTLYMLLDDSPDKEAGMERFSILYLRWPMS